MTNASRDPRTGRFLNPGGFATPPPGAPHETTQGPVSLPEHDIVSAHQRAEQRAAERLSGTSGGGRAEGQTSLSVPPDPHADAPEGGAAPAGQRTGPRLQGPIEPLPRAERDAEVADPEGIETRPHPMRQRDPLRPPSAILGHAPQPEPDPVLPSALDDLTEAFKATHPAASSTDTPSRGIPTPPADPGKQITGGWGPTGSGSEYFALDGAELKAIVIALAARLEQALDGDLRFGLSVVYPQVKIALRLTVDGRSPEGRDLDLPGSEKIDLHWDRILALDAEVEDSASTPAGKIRDDFQIRGPRKQVIRAGAARLLVDVPNEREA